LFGNQREHIDRIELFSWLETLERNFDPHLLKGRNRFNEAEGWIVIWLFRSLLGTSYEKMPDDSVNKILAIFLSKWQKFLTYLGLVGVVGISLLSDFQLTFWQTVLAYGGIAISLGMSLYANLSRMLTLNDPYFNSNAYKLFRKQEYYMLLPYFRENKYTFKIVQEWVKLLYRENDLDSIVQAHLDIQRRLQEEIDELNKELVDKEDDLTQYQARVEQLNKIIEELQRLVKINEDGYNSAISTIFRLRQSDNLFNTSDLRVFTDFSLFELVDDKLLRLCEQGTTETPKIIDINDPEFLHYSSVTLAHSGEPIEYATSDREGRTVASIWIRIPSGRSFIYNFHYESTNERMSDIIEMKELYRYIKGICILLDERGLLTREGEYHVAS
jgi:hypothetical protein